MMGILVSIAGAAAGIIEAGASEHQPDQFYLILIVIFSETSGGLNG
jgi:hypothetical protein